MLFRNEAGEIATGISWTPPRTRKDGTPYLPGEHKGYTVGRADADGVIKPFVSIPATFDVNTWSLDELNITEPGNYTIALATVDSTDHESDFSNTVNFIAAWALPNAPTGLNVF
jgi:hypothetical protein